MTKHILGAGLVCLLVFLCSFTIYTVISAANGGSAGAPSAAAAIAPASRPSSTAVSSSAVSSAASSSPGPSASPSLSSSSSVPSGKAGIPDASGVSVSPAEQISLENAAKPVWIQVDISRQQTTVYDAEDRIVKQFTCSTGTPGDDTPTGTYHIQAKGTSFFSEKYQEGGYYWMQFYGNYWFHSIPFDKNRVIIPAEATKLGSKASHGCVRLAIANEKWMYDHIPKGTKVVVQQ